VAYKINLIPAAGKVLAKLAKVDRRLLKKIDQAILDLAENPSPINCKQLVGEYPPLYRLRVGDYRILYHIESEVLVVLVIHIGHRKDVYRFLK
jgi:mRNA interferase RelE/StbE